jgi:TRAP-type C4-dicarboxylate transport system permease small subunit
MTQPDQQINQIAPMEVKKSILIKWLEHLLVLGLSVMGLMVLANVVLRYVFDSGLAVTEEVARFIFVWLTFVGAIVAMKQGLHLGMDSMVRRLSPKMKLLVQIMSNLLMLTCCALMLKGSLEQTRLNAENVSALSGTPVGLMYAAGIFAALFMGVFLLQDLWCLCTGKKQSVEPSQESVLREF